MSWREWLMRLFIRSKGYAVPPMFNFCHRDWVFYGFRYVEFWISVSPTIVEESLILRCLFNAYQWEDWI
jgi:hypothetical protein